MALRVAAEAANSEGTSHCDVVGAQVVKTVHNQAPDVGEEVEEAEGGRSASTSSGEQLAASPLPPKEETAVAPLRQWPL
jgi:hypothetical protein